MVCTNMKAMINYYFHMMNIERNAKKYIFSVLLTFFKLENKVKFIIFGKKA